VFFLILYWFCCQYSRQNNNNSDEYVYDSVNKHYYLKSKLRNPNENIEYVPIPGNNENNNDNHNNDNYDHDGGSIDYEDSPTDENNINENRRIAFNNDQAKYGSTEQIVV